MVEEKGRGIGGVPDATVKIALEVKGTVGLDANEPLFAHFQFVWSEWW